MSQGIDKEIAYTALCVWEAILEIRDRPDVSEAFEAAGTNAIRSWALVLAAHLEEDWKKVEHEYDECFDWEYVPDWIYHNVDWSDQVQIFNLLFTPKPKPDYFHLGAEAERCS